MSNPQYPGIPGFPQQPQPQAPVQPQAQPAQGYPGPAVPMPQTQVQPPQPMAAPQPQPQPQPMPQAPAMPGAMGGTNLGQIGALIANATMGAERHPKVNGVIGEFVVRADASKKPDNFDAIVVDFTVVESSSPQERPVGSHVSWYQDVSGGDPRKSAAQHGAVLACLVRLCGFETVDAMTSAGVDAAAAIQSCFFPTPEAPAPVVGRSVRVSVSSTGKVSTKGTPINNVSWSVYGG